MNKLLDKIRECVKHDAADSDMDYLAYLMEEVGEVATCLAVKKKLKGKSLKETAEQEGCDVIITMLALILKTNPKWDIDDIETYMAKKVDRWHGRVVKGR